MSRMCLKQYRTLVMMNLHLSLIFMNGIGKLLVDRPIVISYTIAHTILYITVSFICPSTV